MEAIGENADELDAKLLDAIPEVTIHFIIGLQALYAIFYNMFEIHVCIGRGN